MRDVLVGADDDDDAVVVVSEDRVERFPLHGSTDVDAERTRDNRANATGGGVTYGDATVRPPRWLRAAMRSELAYFADLVSGRSQVAPHLENLTNGVAARSSIATAEALVRSAQLRRTVDVREVTGAGLTR